MGEQVFVKDAVEVLLDRGARYSPRWTVGSGFLMGGTLVLTAAHNVGAGELFVRVKGETEYAATIAQIGDVDRGLDLAILMITDRSFDGAPEAIVQFAQLDQRKSGTIKNCWAIGFPRFKEKKQSSSGGSQLRDSHQVDGEIPLGSNVISSMFELQVKARPQEEPSSSSSEWEGMSGAVVFCEDPVHGTNAIGVIVEHNRAEGSSSLTVLPLTAINTKLDEPTARQWWKLLSVSDPRELPHLPASSEINLVAAEKFYRDWVDKTYNWPDFSRLGNADKSLDLSRLSDADKQQGKKKLSVENTFVSLTLEEVTQKPRSSKKPSKAGRDGDVLQEPIELEQALTNHLLIIIGGPGTGKSTLLRWLAVTFAQRTQRDPDRLGTTADDDRLPVLVELGRLDPRYLAPEGGETPKWTEYLYEYLMNHWDNLYEYLMNHWDKIADMPPLQSLLHKALTEGRCLLLFDGLDEIANRQARSRIARSLVTLADQFPNNQMIIGSRPAGVGQSDGILPSSLFRRYQISPFTTEDIQQFFHLWYSCDSSLDSIAQRENADDLFARVQANPKALQLATTPLLSTFLLITWRNKGILPEQRVSLYKECCQMLLEHWETSHGVNYPKELHEMASEDHLRLLMSVAYHIHSQGQRNSAKKEELVPIIAQTLRELHPTEKQTPTLEAERYLEVLHFRSSLLQYIGDDAYGFPHLALQEYLTACHIAAQPDPNFIDLVMTHLHEDWWREVHMLVIEHLGSGETEVRKASKLILTILRLYRPPSWILRLTASRQLCFIELGKLLSQIQFERRIAWILMREFELAARGYLECRPNGVTPRVEKAIAAQTNLLVRHFIYDTDDRYVEETLLPLTYSVSQRQGSEEKWVSILCDALSDYRAKRITRVNAARGLRWVEVGNVVAVNALMNVLSDPDVRISEQAIESIARVGVDREIVTTALYNALSDRSIYVRGQAAKSLRLMGKNDEAIQKVLFEVGADVDDNPPQLPKLSPKLFRGKLADEGLNQGEMDNEAIVNALSNPNKSLLEQLVIPNIAQMGVGNEVVVNALIKRLELEDNIDVRRQAAIALGQVGKGNEAAVNALINVLSDPDVHVRRQAARALGWIGVGNEVVVNALIKRLELEDNIDVLKAVAAALGQVGVGNEAAVNALINSLYSYVDQDVRYAVLESLGLMGGNEALTNPLINALSSLDTNVRRRVAKDIGRVEVVNEAVVNALIKRLDLEDEPTVRYHMIQSLTRVGIHNEVVVNALIKRLELEDNIDVQEQVVAALGRVAMGNEAAVNALINVLSDPEVDVRRQAAINLGEMGVGNKVVVNALLKRLDLEDDTDVQGQVAASLGRLEIKDGVQLQQILVALNNSLHRRNNGIQWYARNSIRQLLEGRPIPGYRWKSLKKRQTQHQRFERIAYWFGIFFVLVFISFIAVKIYEAIDPHTFLASFLSIFLGVLTGIIALAAGVAQILGRRLRDPWDHS